MEILYLEPCRGHGGGGAMMVARFSVKLTPYLQLHNLRLLETPNGPKVHFPAITGGGGKVATMDPSYARQIAESAMAAYHRRLTIADTDIDAA
ncbi:hypothetical protein A4U53_024195 [Rhizobium ruizarguesonis]|uniref:Uncharacterized protein n=2 Tax=Rhizobium TaxID=379 RepID=A0A179BXF1_RHILE|nr:hypothetical protein [Rhizobium leguminosarum]OAP96347.1 hypothetical protein A4U53_14410 [Rhizobium leguminosarum]